MVGNSPVRLNLGCGKKLWEGFINIDFPSNWSGKKPDIEADLRNIPLPDDYADEAHAIHVIEHFYAWEAADVVREWLRIIKPGGKLVIECPNLEKLLWFFAYPGPINDRMTMWGLYGDPGYQDPSMCHKWAYTPATLSRLLEQLGMVEIEEAEPQHHVKPRDMRIEARKPWR